MESPHVAGARYCRARRRRASVPRAPLGARHTAAGIVLVVARGGGDDIPPSRRRGPAAFALGMLALVASVLLLLNGAGLASSTAEGPCPERTSIAARAHGHILRLRLEQAYDGAALVHLCAGHTIPPIRSWTVRLRDGEPVAVQRLGDRLALAVAPRRPGQQTSLAVTMVPEAGTPLTFAADLAVR